MSKIEELIEELCPEGVEFRQLSEVTKLAAGDRVTKANMQHDGQFPAYGAGTVPTGFLNEWNRADSLIFSRAGAGAGYVNFITGKFWATDVCFVAEQKPEGPLIKFVFYWMKSNQAELMKKTYGGSMPKIDKLFLWRHPVPFPPLELQREIVSILDKFTQLEAELEAELEARRIQYEVTRDRLLDFSGDLAGHAPEQKIPNLRPSGIESLELSELGELFSGLSGKSKGDFSDGNSPFVSYLDIGNNSSLPREIKTKVRVGPQERQNEVRQGDLLFTGSSEDREGVGLTAEVEYSPSEPTYLNSFCFGFRPKEGAFAMGYLKHLFRSTTVRTKVKACSNGVTRINISKKSLVKIEIPVPPLEVQANIVLILDKLDALVNDITIGLPAEIAARRKQYEYYRNKLLTFKELEAA